MNYSIDWDGPGERNHDDTLEACPFCNGKIMSESENSDVFWHAAVANDCLLSGFRLSRDDLRKWNKRVGPIPPSILVGGNHLANFLISNLGADFCDRFPPKMATNAALSLMRGDIWDIWVCWREIMLARGDG